MCAAKEMSLSQSSVGRTEARRRRNIRRVLYCAERDRQQRRSICKVCVDDRLTTRIMSGIREPETKRKLLAHTHPPSLQTTLNICRSEESAHNDELTLANSENVSTKIKKIHKHRQYQPGKPRFQNNTSPKGNQCCGYCGKMRHESRDKCPAKQSECTNCKQIGALGSMLSSKTTNRYNTSNIRDEWDPCVRRYRKQTTPPSSAH